MKQLNNLAIVYLVMLLILLNCKDESVNPPADNPPVVVSSSATPTSVPRGDSVKTDLHANDDNGLSRAIIEYLENSSKDTLMLSVTNATQRCWHQYADSGNYSPTVTIEDNAGDRAGEIGAGHHCA